MAILYQIYNSHTQRKDFFVEKINRTAFAYYWLASFMYGLWNHYIVKN